MAEQRASACGASEDTSPGVTLSDSLVTTPRPFPGLLPASTVRLDRRNISSIGKLRRLAEIHSLYLQQNKIEKIENLDSFPNLRFLCLAGNRIPRVENLRCLPHLSALDLSHNRIRELDTEELPRSLQILDLAGNECARRDGYRDLVVAALPQLLELDSQPVRGNAAEEKTGRGFSSSEEDEDEDEDLLPELGFPFTAEQDFFVDLQRELAGRSRRRRKETLQEHQERLEELWERRELLPGPARDGAAGATAPWWALLRARLSPAPEPSTQGTPRTQLSPLVNSTGSRFRAQVTPRTQLSPLPGSTESQLRALLPPLPGSSTRVTLRTLLSPLPESGGSQLRAQVTPRTQLSPPVASSASQPAPGAIQPPAGALEEESGAREAGSTELSPKSHRSSSVGPRSPE